MFNGFTFRTEWLMPWSNRKAGADGIDLGGGRTLPAEDVLESHFKRIAAMRNAPTAQDVRIEVAPNIKAAIRVVAPKLAPLTEIAEELALKMNSVQPEPGFRSDLHRALEEAHRQMAAQRAAQPESRWFQSPILWAAVVVGTTALTILLTFIAWRQRTSSSQRAQR